MARHLFFRTSRATFEQISELFNFIWPTATALWNLRWQVGGITQVLINPTKELVHGRFVAGSGITGANLNRACIEMTWEDQQAEFAKFTLFNLFAIYEGWLALTLSNLGMSGIEKNLQFPTTSIAGGTMRGFGQAFAQVQQNLSPAMKQSFHSALLGHPKNSLAMIENLLKAYRCFKEFRNALMHGGGIADQKCIDAYLQYSSLSSSDMGVSETPKVIAPSLGLPVRLSLRGVVGFSEIIVRLVATLDAELACSQGGEKEFVSQWRAHFTDPGSSKVKSFMLSADTAIREKHLRRLVGKMGLPKPPNIAPLETFLRDHRFVTF